jgi:hypothetical protein
MADKLSVFDGGDNDRKDQNREGMRLASKSNLTYAKPTHEDANQQWLRLL